MSNNWRLPTKDELNAIYNQIHLKGFGRFTSGFYWTSSESSNNGVWYQYFGDGYQGIKYKDDRKGVRLVQDLKDGDTCEGRIFSVDGKYFEAADNDESVMTWGDAMEKYGVTEGKTKKMSERNFYKAFEERLEKESILSNEFKSELLNMLSASMQDAYERGIISGTEMKRMKIVD